MHGRRSSEPNEASSAGALEALAQEHKLGELRSAPTSPSSLALGLGLAPGASLLEFQTCELGVGSRTNAFKLYNAELLIESAAWKKSRILKPAASRRSIGLIRQLTLRQDDLGGVLQVSVL